MTWVTMPAQACALKRGAGAGRKWRQRRRYAPPDAAASVHRSPIILHADARVSLQLRGCCYPPLQCTVYSTRLLLTPARLIKNACKVT